MDDEGVCRAIVDARSGAFCERCGEPGRLDKAHRIARSQGGRWDPVNILDMCRDCHQRNHQNPSDAYKYGWHLRSTQDPRTTPALLWVRGAVGWFTLTSEGHRRPATTPRHLS